MRLLPHLDECAFIVALGAIAMGVVLLWPDPHKAAQPVAADDNKGNNYLAIPAPFAPGCYLMRVKGDDTWTEIESLPCPK